jgi:hypothetical protein
LINDRRGLVVPAAGARRMVDSVMLITAGDSGRKY